MSAASAPIPTLGGTGLDGRRLSRAGVGLLGAGSLLVSGLLVLISAISGWLPFLLIAGLLFLVAQTVASLAVENTRMARDRLARSLIYLSFLIALVPLGLVLGYTIAKGSARMDLTFFTHSMRNVGTTDPGGGVYHAIIGTLEQVGLATAMAVPLGILAAVYLVEYGRGVLARLVTFTVDVMTGLPSIVAGLFILAFWILALGMHSSGFAGSLALAILMIPIVVRSGEEMLRLVPHGLREASYALGIPRWRTILRVVIPTALPGLATGVMLAVARVMGETAPILLVVMPTDNINPNPFSGAQASLPMIVYSDAKLTINGPNFDRTWAAALALIIVVMLLNLLARLLTRRVKISGAR